MVDNIYNKGNKGTLIGNWQEERALKDFTGEPRTIPKEHIPKKWLNFEEPIVAGKQFDNTGDRIHGDRKLEGMESENRTYGKGKNKADDIAKVGKKTLLLEKQYQEQIMQEFKEKEDEEERKRNSRTFETTAKTTFVPKDLTLNPIGKKVMKTQDGQEVSLSQRDEQLLVENNVMNRTQRHPDDLLKSIMPQGHYTQTPAITFYTENLKKKNFYMSAAIGPNPFAKSAAFTQPVSQTRGAKEYSGNVNFEKEQENLAMHKTQKSPTAFSPNAQVSNFGEIRERILGLCRKRSPNSFVELRNLLNVYDNSSIRTLDPSAFRQALKEFGIPLSESELSLIVRFFDRSGDGTINFQEFLSAIRGDNIEANRREIIFNAFNKIDKNQSGVVPLEELYQGYNPEAHPDAINKRRIADDLMKEFMSVWDQNSISVTYEQFEDYYKDVSAAIEEDDRFEEYVNALWKLKDAKRVTFNKGTK